FFERAGTIVESSSYHNTYFIEASVLKEHFNSVFSLVWECINTANFPAGEFKNLKNITKYQVQELYEDPFHIAYKNLRKALFSCHPYRFSILGEVDEIEKISLAEVKNFYRKIFKRNNIIISVVGDISHDKFLEILEHNIKKYRVPRGNVVVENNAPAIKKSKTIIDKKKGANLTALIIGFLTCDTFSEDKFALSFIDNFLGGLSGALFKKVREEHGLAYEISSFSNFEIDTGAFYIYSRIDKKEERKVIKLIEEVLEQIKSKGLSEKELEQFKSEITGTVLRQVQRNIARAKDYGLYTLYNLGLDYTQKYLKKIEELTNQQIKSVASKYLNFDRAIISIVYPE
ncbi:MAG: M16 family metallopeptidase, partial [Planctomycetota bacterium]